MKLSQSALIATLAASVVHAAPAPVEGSSDVSLSESSLAKRQDLENALLQLQELESMRVKRSELDQQLSEREYEIVTKVLSAINDTNLAPTVLKFFINQPTLREVAIKGIVWVLENASINLTTLLKALVDSGLLSRVLTDALSDCEVYVSVINIATDIIKSLLGNLFNKRAEILASDVMTHEETVELLKKDGLMKPSMLESEKRDIDVSNIVNNLLESLGNSGLASSVVIAVLTDPDFIDFGADLIKAVMDSDGAGDGLSISDLVSAVTQSGLLPELLSLLTQSGTLSTIGRNVLKAVTGQCDGADSSLTTKAGVSTTAPATTYPTTTAKTTQAPVGNGDVGTVYTTVKKSSTVHKESVPSDPCATLYDKREFKKLRLNY